MTETERLDSQLLIQRLQAELRTEEMRLVLLKKIRQTQLLAAQQQQQQQQQQANLTAASNDVKSGNLHLLLSIDELVDLTSPISIARCHYEATAPSGPLDHFVSAPTTTTRRIQVEKQQSHELFSFVFF